MAQIRLGLFAVLTAGLFVGLATDSVAHDPAEVVTIITTGSEETGLVVEAGGESGVDLSALDRGELEELARRLAEENAALRQAGEAVGGGGAVVPVIDEDQTTLQSLVAQQAERIAALETQIATLVLRMDTLASLGSDTAATPGPDPAAGASVDTAAVASGDEFDTPANPENPASPAAVPDVGEYLYTYEFGLIREATRGRITLRDKDGNRQTARFNQSEFRDDKIWVTLYFRNDSERPLRYTGLIALGGKQNFNDPRPPLLTQTPFRTPILQPGEVFDLSQEIDIERPWRVEVVELGKIQSYPVP